MGKSKKLDQSKEIDLHQLSESLDRAFEINDITRAKGLWEILKDAICKKAIV